MVNPQILEDWKVNNRVLNACSRLMAVPLALSLNKQSSTKRQILPSKDQLLIRPMIT